MRKVWTMLSFICIFQMAYSQNYNLHVGEDKFLGIPFTNYVVTGSAQWNCTHRQIDASTDDKESGVIITIKQYFSDVATISVTWTEEYFNTHTGHSQFTAHSHTWTIRCIPVNIRLSESNIEMKPGDTKRLNYSWSDPGWASVAQVNWVSSDPSIATVESGSTSYNSYANITAKKPGNVTITANTNMGPSAVCNVTVKSVEPSSVSLPSTALTKVGESVKLSPTLYPSDAETTYSWSSDNTSVATVSQNGKVSGKKTGTANITVNTANGKTATCRVTVEKGDLTLSCNTESGPIAKGTKVTLTANRSDAEIYYTLDGTIPTSSSRRYTGPITINESVTLKAIATRSDYNTSSILTREYQLTSLAILSVYPESKATSANTIPSITFNDYVYESDNLNEIKLKAEDGNVITGDAIIIDGILHFVPSEKLSIGKYKLIIPASAVISTRGEENLSSECQFEIVRSSSEPRMKDIATGSDLFLSVDDEGSLWTWGDNWHGGLGDGSNSYERDYASKIMNNVKAISTDYDRSMAVQEDGTLWAWGNNVDGRLGDGTENDHNIPFILSKNVKSIAQSEWRSFYIKQDGTLWGWGDNWQGTLGNGTRTSETTPTMITDNAMKVSSGGHHTMLIKKDYTLWACGSNQAGSLGFENEGYEHLYPNFQKIMNNIVSVKAGYGHTLALDTYGTLWAWGSNKKGQVGDGTTKDVYKPKQIMTGVKMISAKENQSFAIKQDGTLWAWGNNERYQLGDGTNTERHSPVKIMDNVKNVYADYSRTMAIKKDGSVWIWGVSQQYSKLYPSALPNGFFQANAVESIELKNKNIVVGLGNKTLIQVQCLPLGSDYKTISFGYAHNRLSVNSRGVITPLQVGTTYVTVTVDDQFTATCKVTVEESTEINEVESQRTADGHIYSLSGQRLAAPKKGINIINGRKVIVK